ncbi:MAG: aldehyde dehydrogenase family protein, partial [Planctomycetota bacterium]|nr:aldehyde dehydrogenase family protein [Planctomycetota bacterium]
EAKGGEVSGAKHASLKNGPCDLIGGRVVPLDGDGIRSHNPARPRETVWEGSERAEHVDEAVDAARVALKEWSAWPREKRFEALRGFQALAKSRVDSIAQLISDEVGKPLWEAKQEAGLLAAKVDITLEVGPGGPVSRVSGFETTLSETRRGVCRFRPHGVMAVIGPFNFPAHLPNGHIVPALAVGDTIVLKPSDKTPAVGQLLAELFNEALEAAGAPKGVVNLVQGGAEVAKRLTTHEGINGILFTGSWPVGRRILEANLDHPGRIVALEMGGNNAAVVMDDAHLRQAVIECVRASFATTGQRCTCTRRIVLHERIAERFMAAFVKATEALKIGDPRSDDVFMGPIIRDASRHEVTAFADQALGSGGQVVVAPRFVDDVEGCPGGHFVSPGVIRVDSFSTADAVEDDAGCDVEVFGPLVRVAVVKDLDAAIEQANATRYGLAASIFTASDSNAERFLREAQAGCVNVNTGTAGASGKLPFGGLGHSGNHRPAGAFSLDYCAFPVASMIEKGDGAATGPGMRFDDSWL